MKTHPESLTFNHLVIAQRGFQSHSTRQLFYENSSRKSHLQPTCHSTKRLSKSFNQAAILLSKNCIASLYFTIHYPRTAYISLPLGVIELAFTESNQTPYVRHLCARLLRLSYKMSDENHPPNQSVMVLPSQQIPVPKGRRKQTRPRFQTKVAKRLKQLQSAEAKASAAAVHGLFEEGNSNSLLDHLTNAIADSANPIYQQNHPDEWSDDEDAYVTYRERIERERQNWKTTLPLMFPEFMKCSKKTFQWGDEELWNRDWKSPCDCPDRQEKLIDVVDVLRRKKMAVTFCSCQTDLVRLVQIGLIGGSPKSPVTAFSIRLLRLFHILWKFCRVRIEPFCRAIDEFLDGKNSIILSAGDNRTREWRKPFSAAVDAYREMLNLKEQVKVKALRLTRREQLASNCPCCFGPTVKGKRSSEPNAIHRRHIAASAVWREAPKVPSLFLPQEDVDRWKDLVNNVNDSTTNVAVDACTASHTAADDARGHQTWRGCDETGLFGMACRHDHILKFINIVKSGERFSKELLSNGNDGLVAEAVRIRRRSPMEIRLSV
ncbi:hypothetical protein DFH28DRAFT_932754 [Melampsora americana]|nr:hypothetical protein DFH28DRAFT_932754 [Melampsora americana]